MIKSANVSISDVRPFRMAAEDLLRYHESLASGTQCERDLLLYISALSADLVKCVPVIDSTIERLASKIIEIESHIAALNSKLNDIINKINTLREILSSIPRVIYRTDEEGNQESFENPEYTSKESEISVLESEKNDIENELHIQQQRRSSANDIKGQLGNQKELIGGGIQALVEAESDCRRLIDELETARNNNNRACTEAIEKLKKIEIFIDNYIKIKMKYDTSGVVDVQETLKRHGIQDDVTTSTEAENKESSIPQEQRFSKEDIETHGIEFDETGRICLYDGKVFGGKHNDYATRLEHTPKMDEQRGRFEGERGESKYLPTGKTAKSVKVIDLLKKYGQDGIDYRNAEPDFETCSIAVVVITNMTENRYNYMKEGVLQNGNFAQADIECSKQWSVTGFEGKNNWTARDVARYRAERKLTWHEKCDTKTMVMVASEINEFFSHLGGVAECKKRYGAYSQGGVFDD